MNLNALLRSCLGLTPVGTCARTRRGFRPMLELLKDRLAPAILTVMNANDAGAGSLRAAIVQANADSGDTINFAPGLVGPIKLTSGELAITKPVTINGPGAALLTIDATHASRIFNVDDFNPGTSIAVAISGLTLINGNGSSSDGGAIRNVEALTMTNATLSGNSTGNVGGGIFNFGTLTLTSSTVSDNSATGSVRRHLQHWPTDRDQLDPLRKQLPPRRRRPLQ